VTDQVRINHLKEQREKMLRDALPELDELEAMTMEWLKPGGGNPMARSMVNMPAGPVSRSPERGFPSPMKSVQLHKSSGFATGIESDEDVLEKLRQLREEYAREGEGDPQFFARIDDLEDHLLRQKERQNTHTAYEVEQPQNTLQNQVGQPIPQFMAPPVLGPGLLPHQFPVNFYPPAPMMNPPLYMPPPPPKPYGDQNIERYN